jgi:hypothetical protein
MLIPSCWRQWGFTALESLLLLVALMSGWVITAHYLQQQVKDTVATASARQLKTVSRESHQWVLDHWQPLLRQLEQSDQQGSLDLLPLLQLPHPLPPHNPYQQRYKIALIPEGKRWQLWVTTHDGATIPRRACLQISAQVGAIAGFITQNQASALIVKSWQGLWQLPWPSTLGSVPQTGHLATVQTIDLPQVTSSNQLLSRKPPHWLTKPNQLETDLALKEHQMTFKNQQQQSQFSSRQLVFHQGSPSGQGHRDSQQAPKEDNPQTATITTDAVSLQSSLLWGENAEKTLRLHHFLFTISDIQKNKNVSVLKPVRKLFHSLIGAQQTHTHIQLREPQCASQIHRGWGKLPYHERPPEESAPPSLKKFADSVCQENSANQAAIGRLFLVGSSDITKTATLFICARSTHGVAAFQLNQMKGYQHRPSPKANVLTRTQAADPIRVELPEMLSDDDDEAHHCLNLLINISQHIVFFEQAANTYSKLKKQCSFKVKVFRSENNIHEQDNLDYQLKNNLPSKKFTEKTFNELFEIYCKPLDSKHPEVNIDDTTDAVRELAPSLLILDYQQQQSKYFIKYSSIYKKLIETKNISKFKECYNEKKSKRLNNFINEINDHFNHSDLLIKRVFLNSLIRLQQDYPQWMQPKNPPQQKILGVELPKKIEDIKQAEEILSFLLIVLNKIEEKTQLLSDQSNVMYKKWLAAMSQNPDFYHQLKNSLSEMNTDNKEVFLKEFIHYYNEKSSLNPGLISTLLNQFPSLIQTILSNNNLLTFINRIRNTPEFSSDIREDINNLLVDIVDTYYQESLIIKIRTAEAT